MGVSQNDCESELKQVAGSLLLREKFQSFEIVFRPSSLLLKDAAKRFGDERPTGGMKRNGYPTPVIVAVALVTAALRS